MGKVVAVVNQKGGVGKTTTAINLAAGLALYGQRTLLIDCDPQSNSTGGLGFRRDSKRLSTYDVLLQAAPAREAVLETCMENLHLLPSSKDLTGASFDLAQQPRREFRLREVLKPLATEYDFFLLDCPPGLDLLTLNALVAADTLLVPMQAEYFALEGVSELASTLDRVAAAFQPDLGLEGVVLTMYDARTSLSQQVAENIRQFFGDKVYATVIPRNVRVAEAPSHGLPVLRYDARSRGAEAYRDLAREFLNRNGIAPQETPDDTY